MAAEILESLNELGYTALDDIGLEKCITEGAKSVAFTQLVEWATKEIQVLYSLDDHVNAIATPDDSSAFLLELGGFLREVGCQYSCLTQGRIHDILQSKPNKILLLEYLLAELKSARMFYASKPDTTLSVTLNESPTATVLKNMLLVLNFPKPPANIPADVFFTKVQARLKEVLSKVPKELISDPLFTGKLTDKDWHKLGQFYNELYDEYRNRREMLLKRLDVTIQSFEWSDRLKNKSNEIHSSFTTKRNTMKVEPNVKLSDILAARKDLAILEKTSSASVRRKTQSAVNKVVIGSVPDRGGRPYEQEPPPPEMPSWQQRSTGGGPGGRGGGGGGGGRGGGGRGGNFNAGRGGGGNFGGGGGGSGGNFSDNFNRGGGGGGRGFEGGGRVQAGWNAPQNQFGSFDRQSGSGGYSQGGYQNQGYSGGQSQYQDNSSRSGYSQNNYSGRGGYSQDNSGYDNRSGNRGGYNQDRSRGGYNQQYQGRGGGGGYYQRR